MTANIEEFLKLDEEDDNNPENMAKKKKNTGIQATKKIYPVSITFHQKSKLLAISLIDCDIKIY